MGNNQLKYGIIYKKFTMQCGDDERIIMVFSKTKILQTSLPLCSIYVNRMLDLTSFDFFVLCVSDIQLQL